MCSHVCWASIFHAKTQRGKVIILSCAPKSLVAYCAPPVPDNSSQSPIHNLLPDVRPSMRIGLITLPMFYPARFPPLRAAQTPPPTNLTLSGGEKYEKSFRVTSIRRPLHRCVPFVTTSEPGQKRQAS